MCEIWEGAVTPDGYPRRAFKGNSNTRWHRVVYAQANGLSLEDIEGQVVRHTCDNPLCVDPEHLTIGTAQDNVDDRTRRDRSQGLSWVQAVALAQQHAEGVHYKELMSTYGVSRSTVYHTLKRVNHAGG